MIKFPHLPPDFVEPALAKDNLGCDDGGGKNAELGHLSHAKLTAACPPADHGGTKHAYGVKRKVSLSISPSLLARTSI